MLSWALPPATRTSAVVTGGRRVGGRRSEAELLPDLRLADTRFHLAVAAAAGNARLASTIEDARVAMFQPVDLLDFRFVKHASVDGHDAVLEAIRVGDAEAAADAMHAHISATRVHFTELLDAWAIEHPPR